MSNQKNAEQNLIDINSKIQLFSIKDETELTKLTYSINLQLELILFTLTYKNQLNLRYNCKYLN